MEVLCSLQGHPSSGRQWMKTMDETSISGLGFSAITDDRCICKQTTSEGTILTSRQVDDFPIGAVDEATAGRIAKLTGKRVKFQEIQVTAF